MTFFVRAVLTGFALSLGSALFKKAAPHLGLDDKKDKDNKDDAEKVTTKKGATDPELDD